LHEIGVLTLVDGTALAAYCQAYSRWVEAEKNVKKYGAVLFTKEKKWPVVSPYLAIANQALKQMQSFLNEFGMTPASRIRVEVKRPAAASTIESRRRG
jgi:P27 family predicted phage terminase small subunit